MIENIEISLMNLDDFSLIKQQLTIDFDDFWEPSILENDLQNDDYIYIVAKHDSAIVGFAGLWKSVDDVHITNIVVKKVFRKNGIGSLLLEKLIKIGKELNYTSITLEVNEKNVAAQHLYLKYKFKILGIRRHYYSTGDNAIIMTYFYNKDI